MNNNTVKENKIDKLYDESEKKVITLWGKCTVLAIKLPNGFTIVESTGCVDPINYSEKIGIEICKDNIKNKLWKLEGYKLSSELNL